MEQSAVHAVQARVERTVKDHLRQGEDGRTGFKYSYLRSSPSRNSWQWSWDSCFHAVVLAHVDPELAAAELRTLIAAQEPDGFMGHVNFWGQNAARGLLGRIQRPSLWGSQHSSLIQPPMLAQAVARVIEVTGDAWLAVELLPALDKYHNWLADHRVPDPDGLLVIISPHESGMSQSPTFDEVLGISGQASWLKLSLRDRWSDVRNAATGNGSDKLVHSGHFRVKDALVNSLYADALATMAQLHRRHGQPDVANAYATRSEVVTASLMEKLWDRGRGAFFSLYGPDEQRTIPLTVGCLMPLVIEGLPQESATALVERHLSERNQFWTSYPVPSVSATEESFNPRGERLSWRGPTWMNTNWLLWRGLNRHGYSDLASRLAERSVDMVVQSGLREFYHPHTGRGLGAQGFACSGLALDMGGV
jgi:glycogen debranching enzyme